MLSANELGRSYNEDRPILLRALARLAREGFVARPDEGVEIIHQFYADEWESVTRSYEPTKGDFAGYLYGAFRNFAREQIRKDARRRRHLRSLVDDGPGVGGSPTDEPEALSKETVTAVRHALCSLDDDDRRLLELRVVSGVSERDVSRRLGITRHVLRALSAEALGKLALSLEGHVSLAGEEWQLAKKIWGEEQSIAEAASALGMPRARARFMHRKLLDQLAEGVVAASDRGTGKETAVAPEDKACATLRAIIENPREGGSAQLSPEDREALVAHLEDCDRCAAALEARSKKERSPEAVSSYVASVYEALAGPATEEDVARINRYEEEAVRRATEHLKLLKGVELATVKAIEGSLLGLLDEGVKRRLMALDLPLYALHVALDGLAAAIVSTVDAKLSRLDPELDSKRELLELRRDGSVVWVRKDEVLLEPAAILDRIARGLLAGLSPAGSVPPDEKVEPGDRERRVLDWIVAAARNCSCLFRGLDSGPGPGGAFLLAGPRRLNERLVMRWSDLERESADERVRRATEGLGASTPVPSALAR